MQSRTDTHVEPRDHVVHFYERDDDLAAVVVDHLAGPLAAGDTAVVIATPEHTTAFQQGLRRCGVDVDAALAGARLVVLDAADTASRFVVDGVPDPDGFEQTVATVVRRAAARGRPTHAYGEMVSLLWDEGHVVGALELEAFWNALAQDVAFSLFCAYSSAQVARPDRAAGFAEICELHSEVIGGPQLETAQLARTFPPAPDGPRRARRLVADALRSWGLAHLIDDATVVVSEMATNAVTHARSAFTVSLARAGDTVTIGVGDRDVTEPERRPHDPTAPGGRGLHLIDALATRWGHTVVPAGKLVWADLIDVE